MCRESAADDAGDKAKSAGKDAKGNVKSAADDVKVCPQCPAAQANNELMLSVNGVYTGCIQQSHPLEALRR